MAGLRASLIGAIDRLRINGGPLFIVTTEAGFSKAARQALRGYRGYWDFVALLGPRMGYRFDLVLGYFGPTS